MVQGQPSSTALTLGERGARGTASLPGLQGTRGDKLQRQPVPPWFSSQQSGEWGFPWPTLLPPRRAHSREAAGQKGL